MNMNNKTLNDGIFMICSSICQRDYCFVVITSVDKIHLMDHGTDRFLQQLIITRRIVTRE